MPEIDLPFLDAIREVTRDGLHVVSPSYRRRYDGSLQYDGERPGPGWHAHGYFAVGMLVLVQGVVRRAVLHKKRWFEPDAKVTCHSRPPDDPVGARSSTLVVFVALWSWLTSRGLRARTYEPVFPDLDLAVSRRTMQRWLRRALFQGEPTQQAIRMAVIERSEPRPVERLFPQGLPPPRGLLRRHWRDPLMVGRLFRAQVIAVAGSIAFQLPLPILLAEARGRWDGPCDSLVI
jgi:hypothetical protein